MEANAEKIQQSLRPAASLGSLHHSHQRSQSLNVIPQHLDTVPSNSPSESTLRALKDAGKTRTIETRRPRSARPFPEPFPLRPSSESIAELRPSLGKITPADRMTRQGIYAAMPVHPPFIRLLEVLPGSFTDNVMCTLRSYNVESAPPYRALSYAWKNDDDEAEAVTDTIICNNISLLLSRNLHDALVHLRGQKLSVLLWVDALCIDQANDIERSEQVSMMQRIYQSSAEVAIWLGRGRKGDYFGSWPQESKRDQATLGFHGDLRDQNLVDLYVKSFDGDYDVSESWTGADILGLFCLSYLLSQGFTPSFYSYAVDFRSFRQLKWTSRINEGLKYIMSLPWVRYELYLRLGHSIEFLSVLRKFRSREASDSRDKVFAVLGIVSQSDENPLTPDYSLDSEEVFRRTTIQLISKMQSLSALAGTTGYVKQQRQTHVPSWVTDWTKEVPPLESERLRRTQLYHASGSTIGRVALHGTNVLEVTGLIVDEIIATGYIAPEGGRTRLRGIIKQWDSLRQQKSPLTSLESFCRVVCADVVGTSGPFKASDNSLSSFEHEYLRATEEVQAAYTAWEGDQQIQANRHTSYVGDYMVKLVEDKETSSMKNSFQYAVETASSLRRFFVTASGRIGIGPSSLRKHDNVCLLLGSRLPFVIRHGHLSPKHVCRKSTVKILIPNMDASNEVPPPPVELESQACLTKHANSFKLVGDCYVHGIMDGEIMERGEAPQSIFLW
ncbi:MAG: hypothetical protein Q9227_008921 [Pyrenula ochraceoflavens]